MSDVYTPPEADLIGTSDSAGAGTTGRGVFPMEVGPVISRAWELLQPALVPAALGTLALFAIHMMLNVPLSLGAGLLQGGLAAVLGESAEGLVLAISFVVQIGVSLIGQVTAALLTMGLAKGSHTLVTTGTVEVGDFLPFDGGLILRGFLAQLLLAFITLLGFLLFIVPGVVLALGLILWPYAMVVEGLGPVDSMKRSWQLMDGAKLQLFLFGLALGMLSMFVVPLSCGFGLLVVMPFMFVAYALIYVGAAENKPALTG
jgi:hypothetical protein